LLKFSYDLPIRFSEEDGKNQTQSKKIDWLELAKAFEESSTQLGEFQTY